MSEQCQICGVKRPRSMEEHHILPRRFGGSDTDDNLVVLCANCHRAVESIYDKQFWESVGLRPTEGSNTITEFADRMLDIDQSHGPVPKADLYSRYSEWCEAGNVEPKSKKKFTMELTRLNGISSEKTYVDDKQCRCYTGVAISPLIEPAD